MSIQQPTHVIAIGASAGGLEALTALFESMPSDLSVSYVVVQHLSPDFKSLMSELLAKKTNMECKEAQEGDELAVNTVYLIPSGKFMRLAENRLYLSDIPPQNRINLPINEFFRSLAEDKQHRSVGIVLSGTGSDGSRGIQALKAVGGLVISQDPQEAAFDGMPLNAISTGCVDFILPIKEMSEKVRAFIEHPRNREKERLVDAESTTDQITIDKILSLVQAKTTLDFKAYKSSTIGRRIEHRMSILGVSTLAEYYNVIVKNLDEVKMLKQDLLIGVTQFFRDREVWKILEGQVAPEIIKRTPEEQTIRVWCAGCSSGEEPYTIAMIFLKVMEELNIQRNIKVFASDVDQSAVSVGATGEYPASIASEVPSEYLQEFFTNLSNGNYQVTKELRSAVVFATHNLIQDPPFSNMDMVSCRNTLIYLQQNAQQRALSFFHFALKVKGYLLLGSAENTNSYQAYFDVKDSKNRVYFKNKDLRIPLSSIPSNTLKGYKPRTISNYINENIIKTKDKLAPKNVGSEAMLEVFAKPTVIVDKKCDVIYSYGDTSLYTEKIRPGNISRQLIDIIRDDIKGQAITMVNQVFRENEKIVFNALHFVDDSTNHSFDLLAFPIDDPSYAGPLVGLSFVEVGTTDMEVDRSYTLDEQTKRRIEELDRDLVESQKRYREALEDIDSTSEELQSSNEELMAANEELQSTNEELQSVNEELYTVNGEYQLKINELTSTNYDLQNILEMTQMAVIFLDEDLKIRRYTPACKKYVNILDTDIERQFFDLKIAFECPELPDLVKDANDNGGDGSIECDFEERKIQLQVRSYQSGRKPKGVIITIKEER